MTPPPALQVLGLQQRFGATDVLRGVDLAVQPGERVALIGPNGAGKSTLFDAVSGRRTPWAGDVWLHGQRVTGLPPPTLCRLGLGRSFQTSRLFGRLSVADNLRSAALHAHGVGATPWRRLARLNRVDDDVDALLDTLGLAAQRRTPAQALSYAEQRHLELGLVLAGQPRVLLLDEPTAGMSRSETAHIVALLRRLSAGRTLLMVEHDMSVVFELADRIAVMEQGRLIALDTPAAVRANSAVRRAYLGQDA